jgi:hypothetical protein
MRDLPVKGLGQRNGTSSAEIATRDPSGADQTGERLRAFGKG